MNTLIQLVTIRMKRMEAFVPESIDPEDIIPDSIRGALFNSSNTNKEIAKGLIRAIQVNPSVLTALVVDEWLLERARKDYKTFRKSLL